MKLFRKTVAVIALAGMSFMFAQDIAGDYRLNGTNVRYTSLYRGATPAALYISDSYGMGITLPALTFQPMSPMNQFVNGPYPKNALNAIGVNLNLSMYSDGTGHIYEGSMYPTALLDEETCVSAPGVLPATDFLGYTSNLDAELPVQSVSILGEPTLGPYGGGTLGSISLQQADIFDFFPAVPTYMDYTGSPAASPEQIAFPGPAAGYITKTHTMSFLPELNGGAPLNPLDLLAGEGINVTGYQAPGDLYMEWHAIDGGISQSGFGDDELVDEDGDGTPYDRILGIPYVPVSYANTECGGGDFDPFDFRTLDPSIPILGDNNTMIAAVSGGGVDLCYGSGGLDVLAGGVCMQAILTDADGSGMGDMNEVCMGLAAGGVPENVAASIAIEGTCNALGIFTAESCATVAVTVEADANAGAVAACCGQAMGNGSCSVDSNGTATDTYGDGCEWYDLYPSDCCSGPDCPYNDDDFDSAAMCASCGGGDVDADTYGYCEATYGNSWGCEMMAAVSTPDPNLGGLAPVCGGLISLATACLDEDGAPMDCPAGEVCDCATGFGNCETFGNSYAEGWAVDCLEGEGTGNQFYAINPAFADYGMYTTANSVQMAGCLAAGDVDAATCGLLFGTDDSDHDFDGTDGRLVMNYTPQCFPELQMREVYVDFTELDAGTCFDGPGSGSGDVDNSCADGWGGNDVSNCLNVADIVLMVQAILGTQLEFQETCRGDIDANGIINVVDVVQTVQMILNGLVIDATSTEIIKTVDAVQYTSDGVVGAFQFTISHDEDFSIELTDKALVADYSTFENKTTVVIVMPETEQLFTAFGQYEISQVLAANSEGLIESSVVTPEDFTLSNAYPNPFNPTTSLLLNLDQDNIVAVKAFNVNGQLVDVLTDGGLEAGLHTITWDAQEFASGVYFIKAYIGSEVITQKVSLMK